MCPFLLIEPIQVESNDDHSPATFGGSAAAMSFGPVGRLQLMPARAHADANRHTVKNLAGRRDITCGTAVASVSLVAVLAAASGICEKSCAQGRPHDPPGVGAPDPIAETPRHSSGGARTPHTQSPAQPLQRMTIGNIRAVSRVAQRAFSAPPPHDSSPGRI